MKLSISILTEEQLDLCQKAYDANMKTKDPVVNYFVDCFSDGDFDLEYDSELYKQEIKVWKNTGGAFIEDGII